MSESEDEWVSTEDRLPEHHGLYLIAMPGGVQIGTWIPEQNDFQGNKLKYCEYWRDIPEPPKSDSLDE